MQEQIQPLLLTPPEAAKALGISERTLFDLTKEGKLLAVRIRRLVRYSWAELQAFIERQQAEGKA